MKKVLFMLIALFTYGNVCKAQLPAASVLKAETQTAGKQKKVKTRADEAAQGDAYWFTSRSYYDERGQFSIGNGPLSSYQARFTFDGENVTISNLVDNKSYNMLSTETISGYYDPDDKNHCAVENANSVALLGSNAETEAVGSLTACQAAPMLVSSLSGIRLRQPSRGINIVRRADGTVVKRFVK